MGFLFHFLRFFGDILFPRPELVRRLEAMSSREILAAVAVAGTIENLAANPPGRFFALFKYSDPLTKQIVWEIKYRANKKLAGAIGVLIYEKLSKIMLDRKFSGADNLDSSVILIPIPASLRRLRLRGFNQTELIARAVMENAKTDTSSFSYHPNILIKTKNTPAQSSLTSRASRLSNLRGVFVLKDVDSAEVMRGKNIILIDDVITTGATMKEVVEVITRAGAKSVIGVAIAH